MRLLVIAVVVSASGAVGQAGQVASPAGGGLRLVRGVVEADASEAVPLRRARIVVTAPGLSADPVFTDDRGRFATYVPVARSFALTISKPGFARRETSSAAIRDGTELRIRLPRGAVITGLVVDPFGDPTTARVLLEGAGARVAATTDDLGEYRFGSLAAGRYTVMVSTGGMAADARAVDVSAGQEVMLAHVTNAVETRPFNGRPVAVGAPGVPGGVTADAGIRGRVAWPDGRPIGGVSIIAGWMGNPELPDAGDQTRMTETDAAGRYELADLVPGRYRVVATKLSSSLFDATRDRSPVVVESGEFLEAPDITLARAAWVSGTVSDEHGEPMEGLTVQLWERRTAGGRALLLPVNNVRGAHTDDRGRYRLSGAPAGAYYVVVSDEPQTESTASPQARAGASTATRVYYPGVPAAAEAMTVHVDTRRGADGVNVVFARSGVQVTGFAFDADGRPLTSPLVLMDSHRSGFPSPARRTAAVAADGTFTFSNVPAGDYVLQGIVAGPRGRPEQFAMQYVTVSGESAGPALLRTLPGATVSGRIVLEGEPPGVPLDRFGLSAQPADWDYVSAGSESPTAVVAEDGRFEMALLFGPMRITGSAPGRWWLKSVHVGGVDAAEQAVAFSTGVMPDATAVFADTGASLAGYVRDETGARASAYSVLVFSTDRNRWWAPSGYVMLARPDDTGRFATGVMPPGDYLAAAVDTFDIASEWLDPELLATLAPQARSIALPPRDDIAVDLELIRRAR